MAIGTEILRSQVHVMLTDDALNISDATMWKTDVNSLYKHLLYYVCNILCLLCSLFTSMDEPKNTLFRSSKIADHGHHHIGDSFATQLIEYR
jgi:hypothetical protein